MQAGMQIYNAHGHRLRYLLMLSAPVSNGLRYLHLKKRNYEHTGYKNPAWDVSGWLEGNDGCLI
jgi:hypothetical protein